MTAFDLVWAPDPTDRLEVVDADGCLGRVADAARAVREAEVAQLDVAVRWCELNTTTDVVEASHWLERNYASPIGGDGAPYVSHQAAEEYAAALGVSTRAGQVRLANALDLKHRLPSLYARVTSLQVPVWRAERIATRTHLLNRAAAAYVDRQLAAQALTCGIKLIDDTVAEAAARFDPAVQADLEARAAARADVSVQDDTASTASEGAATGMSWLNAYGDTQDMANFHHLVGEVAEELRLGGDESDLGIRKAKAIGVIADRARAHRSCGAGAPATAGHGRAKVLYVHVTAADLHTEHTPLGVVEKLGTLTVARIAEWFGDKFTLRPVLDLSRDDRVDRHDPPEPIRETVILRDKTCRFPWCDKDARACDLDHIDPYLELDKGGTKGQTRPSNLAPLCRRHHNDKTWRGWKYQRLPDTSYHWTSPHGHTYVVNRHGTFTP